MSKVAYEKGLFGLNKDGSFKVWNIEVKEYICPVEEVETVALAIAHGKEGGKQTEKVEFFESGHQGRTPVEQAILEAKARVKKQMDKNYRETKEELSDIPVLAMLAKDHTKVGKEETVNKGVYTSDKLDGVRCLAKCTADGVTLESRTGQPYDVPHIVEALKGLMHVGDVLDGELYVHGPSLQDITSAVKRVDAEQVYVKANEAFSKAEDSGTLTQKHLDAVEESVDILNIREALEFHVFDLVTDKKFCERRNDLAIYAQDKFNGPIIMVEYKFACTMEELNAQLKACIDDGYEGIMYRTQDGMYESGKRSSGLWKYKLFFDEEFKIIGAHVDKQGYIVFELQNNVNDEEFDCVMGDYAWRTKAAEEKELYIGQWMTVQFQSRYKGTLLPQFPTGKQIRNGNVVNGKFVPSE